MPKITRQPAARAKTSVAKAAVAKKAVAKAKVVTKAVKPKTTKLKRWTTAEIHEAFSRFQTSNPEPKGELEHLNPYTLLVAVVLSAQATDAGVNKATRALFPIADTPQKMIDLGEETVREYIKASIAPRQRTSSRCRRS
jgi:endonuclease III